MNTSAANKTTLGAVFALGVLSVVALLAAHDLGTLAGAVAILSASLVALMIHREMTGRQRAETELRRAQQNLEQRVADRVAEINTANVALQVEVLERQRAEEALRAAHDELRRAHQELETRVAERTRELAEANGVLQHEIVERKKIAEALKNSRTLYYSLIENLPVNVWRTDSEGRFTFVNEHLCDCMGVSQEEFLGKTAYDFYTKATAEQFTSVDRHVLRTGDAFENIHEFETRTGRCGFEQVLMTPCQDGEGHVVGVQGISWDVTERMQAAEEMRRIQAQLERTNRDLVHKNEEIQSFYHTLSHELKTPLTSAREFIAIVRDGLAGQLNATQREYLGIALDSCNQLRVCINDLLDVTRLETGKLSIERKPASLIALVQRIVTALRPVADSKQIDLVLDAEERLPDIPIDESRIAQVLTNLLSNALKFTREGGRISVRVAHSVAQPDLMEVSVSDTGSGIPDDQQERIFDRLYQVKAGDAAVEHGIGLGLYICRELVRLHGGEIQVESEVGVGSTFTFTLPNQPEKRSNLLLVDDDPTMRDILRRLLEREHFAVSTAGDGEEALQVMRHQLPDVVLLDLEMPGMDGPTTMQEIRKHWGSVPVIVHTGQVDGQLMTRALEWSPFTVLAKPCPMDQLVRTVRGVERNRHGTSAVAGRETHRCET